MTLKDTAERERVRFVENEIDLSTTFLALARTEADMGEAAAVKSLRDKARVGFETAAHFMSGIQEIEEREGLQAKHEQLSQLLSTWGTP